MTALVVVGARSFIEENESKGVLAFYSLVGLGLATAEDRRAAFRPPGERVQREHRARRLCAFLHFDF